MNLKPSHLPSLMPDDVYQIILKREWNNLSHLKERLLGTRKFPIKIPLKPPTGKQAVEYLNEFKLWIDAWLDEKNQSNIVWEVRTFRQLSTQKIPCYVQLNNIEQLIQYLGNDARQRSEKWKCNMSILLPLDSVVIYPVLVKHLSIIESMQEEECHLLHHIVQQLFAGMGQGLYLRALPLVGADTKFLEQNQTIIADLLDAIHDDEITNFGGLLSWLACLNKPNGWLSVRPLCEHAQQKMGGFNLLKLSTDELRQHALPAKNILVIENIQSGLAVPMLKDTIAVFGGGNNVSWLSAPWLTNKNLAYWGDVDTWGLSILSDARCHQAHIKPLMMNMDTLKQFESRMVEERQSVEKIPKNLTHYEEQLFLLLKEKNQYLSRLEQERLSMDYIVKQLSKWVN